MSSSDPASVSPFVRLLGAAAALLFAGAVLLGVYGALHSTSRPPSLLLDTRSHVRAFVERGDWERVVRELEAELHFQASPSQRADVELLIGGALARIGRHAEAAAQLRDAVAQAPERREPRILLLRELAALGRYDELAVEYRALLARAPSDARLRSGLGYALERQRDDAGAIAEYRQAVAQGANLVQASYGLGSALLRLGRADEAVAPLQRAVALRPDVVEAQAELASALLGAGRRAEAIAALRRVAAQPGADAVALNNLAWLLATDPSASEDDAREAVRLAERAAALERDAAALDTLAVAYAAAGRFEEATRSAQSALELAHAAGDARTSAELGERLRLFGARRPYRVPPQSGAQ